METSTPPRVRFAPSPTGALHIGGLRTALYNYLFAKKTGGTFILRVEDTDQTRYVPGAEDYIVEALEWAGLPVSESPQQGGPHGPYRQSERQHMYAAYAQKLIDSGNAYYAFDTAEELDNRRANAVTPFSYNAHTRLGMRNSLTLPADEVRRLLESGADYTIRLKCPADEIVSVRDIVRGKVEFRADLLDDKVMLKSDGMPTYHLANVVDDHLMRITHVIRGEEWLPSTAHHVLLYRAFGWESTMPQFAHLPLILKPAPASYINRKNVDSLTVKFTTEFFKKNPNYNHKTKEQVSQYIRGILVDVNSLATRVQVKKKDKPPVAIIKEFLKNTLFGKLSKRDGDRLGFPVFPLSWNGDTPEDSFKGFREVGFDPAALINFLAFLGWNPGSEQEIFSLDELVDAFSLERIGKSGARFDYEKTKWFNQQYLIRSNDADLAKRLRPLADARSWQATDTQLETVAALFKERAVFIGDIMDKAAFLFEGDYEMDEKTARKKWKPAVAEKNYELISVLENMDEFTPAALEATIKGFVADNGLKFGDVFAPLRLAVSGVGGGPSLFGIFALLGKEKVVKRLRKSYAQFEAIV